jgi:hypothetical protein
MNIKDFLKDSKVKEPYKGLTHFPKGSALEGLRIPRPADARRAAKNLLKALKDPTGMTPI